MAISQYEGMPRNVHIFQKLVSYKTKRLIANRHLGWYNTSCSRCSFVDSSRALTDHFYLPSTKRALNRGGGREARTHNTVTACLFFQLSKVRVKMIMV